MQFLKRSSMVAGALALAALLLILAAPKRVHAAVAPLIQVANTIANPAITQDTSKTAAQLVNLFRGRVLRLPLALSEAPGRDFPRPTLCQRAKNWRSRRS